MARHRVTPEERRFGGSGGPLFDRPLVEAARATGHAAAQAAASRASSLEPNWKEAALETVRAYAEVHDEPFLFEQLRFAVPEGADRRAIGHVAKEAQRRGWIAPSGYAPAVSSNGTPKCRWRSRICKERAPRSEPPTS